MEENKTKLNAASFNETDDVFSRVAESYDTLCDLFSLYTHRLWKSYLAKSIVNCCRDGTTILDLASGTGDIAIRTAIQLKKQNISASISVSDICPKMLSIAKQKAQRKKLDFNYLIVDAHTLSDIPDDSVDICSFSFAMKICDRKKVLQQVYRILKPEGVFFCLEASKIPWDWLQKITFLI